MPPLLDVRQLTRRFGGVLALDEVSLAIQQGETVGLIGPNGAGKTTFFNSVTGVLRPTAGDVRFGRETPESLIGLAPHEITQRGIARTFQNIRLFAGMSVLENVVIGSYVRTHAGIISASLLTPEARREEQWAVDRAIGLLEFFGLAAHGRGEPGPPSARTSWRPPARASIRRS